MTDNIKEIKQFTSKSGKNIKFRYISPDDADMLHEFINTISKEDTFIRFSGESISINEETEYVQDQVNKNNKGDAVNILATHNGRVIGYCGIDRNTINKKRSLHVGEFGLSITKEFRDDGIGHVLSQTTIDEAKINIPGLKIIQLTVFEPNAYAQHLYRKLGFVEYGRFPKGILYRDEYVDEIGMYLVV
ncbi:MAG: GNAT family protein [bacterium]|nr:GNAT family protein [bacterium]